MKSKFLILSFILTSIFVQASDKKAHQSIVMPIICKSSKKSLFECWCSAQSLDSKDAALKTAFVSQSSIRRFELPDRLDIVITRYSKAHCKIVRRNPYEIFLSEVMKQELLLDHEVQKIHANKGRRILEKLPFMSAFDYMQYQREESNAGTLTLTKDGRDVFARLVCQHKKPEKFLEHFARDQKLSLFCIKDIAKLVADRNAMRGKAEIR